MLLLCGTLTHGPCLSNTVRWPASHNVTCWSKQRKGSSVLLNICKARCRFGIQSRWCITHEDPSCLLVFKWSMFFNAISALILFCNPKQFGSSILPRPVARGNQGWVNQRTGSPAGRRKGYEAHMHACVSFHRRRAVCVELEEGRTSQ